MAELEHFGPPTTENSATGIPVQKLIDNHQLFDQLAQCLDREFRVIKYWSHLAFALGIPPNIWEQFNLYREYSPTTRLFEFLAAKQPNLSIAALKDALVEIYRVDIDILIGGSTNFRNEEKVAEMITWSSSDVLDYIAQKLDTAVKPLGNWEDLARKLDVSRVQYLQFKMYSSHNPTVLLFRYLFTNQESLTIKDIRDKLQEMGRNDVLQLLQKESFQGGDRIRDTIKLDSDILAEIAQCLNKAIQGLKAGWRGLGTRLGVRIEILEGLEPPDEQAVHSPTKKMISWLASAKPHTKVVDIITALEKIQRTDAIRIIYNYMYTYLEESADEVEGYSPTVSYAPMDASAVSYPPYGTQVTDSVPTNLRPKTYKNHGFGFPQGPKFLTGRSTDRQNLTSYLVDSECRMVVVYAPPGFGKTTLVVQTAHDLINQYDIFAVYINSRHVYCIDDLAVKILEAYGTMYNNKNPVPQALRLLETFGRETVLIIENLDNMLHARDTPSRMGLPNTPSIPSISLGASSLQVSFSFDRNSDDQAFRNFVQDIAECCPRVHLVVTSWERLDFFSFTVQHHELEPLDEKDSVELLMHRSEGALEEDKAAQIAICCGGIPLLLCASVVTLLKMQSDIQDIPPTELLNILSPTSLPPEQRMKHCLGICFDRMDQALQELLITLSVFPDNFTMSQLKTLTIGTEVSETLLQERLFALKHKYCFIRCDTLLNTYTCHSVMRSFGITKACNDSYYKPMFEAARKKFIYYYLDALLSNDRQFFSHKSKSAMTKYRRERENIRQIIQWCITDTTLDSKVKFLCIDAFVVSSMFLVKVMTDMEFERLFSKLAQLCKNDGDSKRRSDCLTCQGAKMVINCMCCGQLCYIHLERAIRCLEKADNLIMKLQKPYFNFTDANYKRTRALFLSKYGRCLVRRGDWLKGFDLIEKAIKKCECWKDSAEKKEVVTLAACHDDLAAAKGYCGKHTDAIDIRTNHVLPIYEKVLGDHHFTSSVYSHIASSYLELGNYSKAIEFNSKALECRRSILSDHQDTARSLFDMGVTFSAQAQSRSSTDDNLSQQYFREALVYLEKALNMQERVLHTPEEMAKTHQELAVVLTNLERDSDAEDHMEKITECIPRNRNIHEEFSPVMSPTRIQTSPLSFPSANQPNNRH